MPWSILHGIEFWIYIVKNAYRYDDCSYHIYIMKIALVGPGIMPIPPPGWGAVEILIWDYYLELTKQGHQADIINKMRTSDYDQSSTETMYSRELIQTINDGNYDFVHIHYDCLYYIMPYLTCRNVGITSHFPYIDQPNKYGGFDVIFHNICYNRNHSIFALSKKDYSVFEKQCIDKSRLFLLVNGANHNKILPNYHGENKEKSIYIAKVDERKQQRTYCTIPDIDFYGKCDDGEFTKLSCYRGEKSHDELMEIMAGYGNLVLLSKGEADPLVIKEALMAGLSVVTNSYSSGVFDTNLPFIDIIPDDKLGDFEYIEQIIQHNRNKQNMKDYIRKYSVEHFSWEKLVGDYIRVITLFNTVI